MSAKNTLPEIYYKKKTNSILGCHGLAGRKTSFR